MTRKTGQEMADQLSDFINSASYGEVDALVNAITGDHRALQQDTFSMMLRCISEWSVDYKNGNFDARNERAVKSSNMMMKVFD